MAWPGRTCPRCASRREWPRPSTKCRASPSRCCPCSKRVAGGRSARTFPSDPEHVSTYSGFTKLDRLDKVIATVAPRWSRHGSGPIPGCAVRAPDFPPALSPVMGDKPMSIFALASTGDGSPRSPLGSRAHAPDCQEVRAPTITNTCSTCHVRCLFPDAAIQTINDVRGSFRGEGKF